MQDELRTFRKRAGLLAGVALLLLGVLLLPGRKANAAARTVANIVVFAVGSDDTATTLQDGVSAIAQAYNNEFHEYFATVSNGALTVNTIFPQMQGGTAIPFVLSNPAASYTDSTVIVSEVVTQLRALNITWSGDNRVDYTEAGVVDNLTVIVQNVPTGDGLDIDDALYPHKGVSGDDRGIANGGSLLVRNYNIINSGSMLSTAYDGSPYCNGYDVAIHEFFHTLGLPDLYPYYDSTSVPVGQWCVMATGMLLRYPLSFFRAQEGWIPMTEVTEDGQYTLNAVSASGGTRLIKITTPYSTTEAFYLEYRIKSDTVGAIDAKIPETGLLVYRVNNSVESHTNKLDGNYIYVFRPGNTSANDTRTANLPAPAYPTGGNANNVNNAAINPGMGEYAYGSTDLSLEPDQADLIYYSDGRNSGVSISNATLSQDGQSITFDLSFAEYDTETQWPPVTTVSAGNSSSLPSVCVHNGGVYVSGTNNDVQAYNTFVVQQNDAAWAAVGGTIGGVFDATLRSYNGSLYLLCSAIVNQESTQARLYKLNGSTWTLQWTDSVSNPGSLQFVESTSGLYYAYVNGKQLSVRNAIGNTAVFTGPTAAHSLANPAVCETGGTFFVAYTDYNGTSGDPGYLARYTAADGLLETPLSAGTGNANVHDIVCDGTSVYALYGGSNPRLAVYSGGGVSVSAVSELPANYTDLRLFVYNGTPHILYASAQSVYCLKQTDTGFVQYGDKVFSGVYQCDATLSDATLYVAAAAAEDNAITVRSKVLTASQGTTPTPTATPTPTPTATPEVTPPAGNDYTVRLTPPDGYTDTTVWIDGVSYTAAVDGGQYAVALSGGNATSAIVYRYNGTVPVGMSVYLLSHRNGAYTVTPVPILTDLLSYHGFSIRVKGVSGIRFKTGISTALRPRLLSAAGADGYRLIEYGTLVMDGSNFGTFPLVLNGMRTVSGKAYWTENGRVNDKIFETKDGRYRFTSVLTRLPPTEYRTNFAFRGYAILEKDGARLTLYGPVMARSIYRIAEQVIASGEFPPDSDAGRYVQSILDNAQ